eukprot:8080814-Alexandrium_andersonii.AAC.1
MGAATPTRTQIHRLEAKHCAFLRGVAGIPTTWGSLQMERAPISNLKVSNSYGGPAIASRIQHLQLLVLGHVLRRDIHSPVQNFVMDRLFAPR